MNLARQSQKCFKCNQIKSLEDFYAHKGMAIGRVGVCKECSKNSVRLRYEINKQSPEYVEKQRKRGREKYHRLYVGHITREANASKESIQKYNRRFPEKYKAKKACQRLQKVDPQNHLHHWSYQQKHWKDIIELPARAHAKAHRFIKYDQSEMMYRRVDTWELLDTKEKHEQYILFCIETKED